jgi:hypothetical protein
MATEREINAQATWAIQWQHTANIVGNTLVEALPYLISPYNIVT